MSAMAPHGQKPREKKDADSSAKMPASGAMSSQDRDFAVNAAKGGMTEVDMGKMGQKQGVSPEVQKLGAMIVADHTKANNELMSIAQAKGLKLDPRHKMEKLDNNGNFDNAWLSKMVQDHETMTAMFQAEAKSGTDPDLKSFATKTLPTLKKHLAAVKSAQKKMGVSAKKKA